MVLATGQTQPRIPSWVPEQQTTQRKGNTIIHSDSMRVNDPTFRRSIKNKVASNQPLIPPTSTDEHVRCASVCA